MADRRHGFSLGRPGALSLISFQELQQLSTHVYLFIPYLGAAAVREFASPRFFPQWTDKRHVSHLTKTHADLACTKSRHA